MPNPIISALPDYAVVDEAFQDTFTTTSTPAGTSQLGLKTPGAFWDYYTSFFVFLSTSVAVGNRQLRLQVQDQNNVVITEAPAPSTQGPNTFTNYSWTTAVASPYVVASSIGTQTIPMIDLFVISGWTLWVIGQGIDPGDTMFQVSATRIRYPTGSAKEEVQSTPTPLIV